MTIPDHDATQSSHQSGEEVKAALDVAKDAFQPAWERLYEAFRVAVFDVLADAATATPKAAQVSRVLVTYSPMLGDVDVGLQDINGQPVHLERPSELAELLREAHGFLNFNAVMADFRAR